jgi:hypothetical protein
VPELACSHEKHCLIFGHERYCNLDGKCFDDWSLQGSCQPKPQSCPELDEPVCGCDGKTYPNSCTAHLAGVSVAEKQPCEKLGCDTLAELYRKMVRAAKHCGGSSDFLRCGVRVKREVGCPCETFVDDHYKQLWPIKALDALFAARGCTASCPAEPCPALGEKGVCNKTQQIVPGVCQDT